LQPETRRGKQRRRCRLDSLSRQSCSSDGAGIRHHRYSASTRILRERRRRRRRENGKEGGGSRVQQTPPSFRGGETAQIRLSLRTSTKPHIKSGYTLPSFSSLHIFTIACSCSSNNGLQGGRRGGAKRKRRREGRKEDELRCWSPSCYSTRAVLILSTTRTSPSTPPLYPPTRTSAPLGP
jgi:hypothetical protein